MGNRLEWTWGSNSLLKGEMVFFAAADNGKMAELFFKCLFYNSI